MTMCVRLQQNFSSRKWVLQRASVNTFKHGYLGSQQAEFNQILFYLQAIRTFITSRTSSKFGQIGLRTME